ncbi:hypothetical protein ILUMI_02776 [Ignelater luminosus]|uniref:C3H1-type domain-containing protein n=1 Tax=Ignelater luminosus TaxID=2038154 RepID=A0A8K0DC53_IGNLU|nr:hypothetical protein ILUMI_02776 [Ignelater luminosus]
MTQEEILDTYFKQTMEKEAENINEAVMHYDPQDEAKTCKNLRPDGTCYKGKRCRFRHIPLTSGYTMDKVPVYDKAFNEDPLPQTGEVIMISISHVVNIQHFYAQIRKENKSVVNYNQTLSGLIKLMNDNKRIKKYAKLKYPPSLSQMVIVKHWNTYWYRGQVRFVEIPENNDDIMVEVYIVDFGDIVRVPITDLRTMIPEFLHLSFQAVECRLYNVEQKLGVNIEDAKKHFETTYLSETFKAQVMATPGYLEVLLEDDKGNDVGLKLIEAGFGELRTEHCFPHDNELMLID